MSDLPVSNWVEKHGPLFPPKAKFLDVACGGGRHSLFLARQGCVVTAVDIDTAAVRSLAHPEVYIVDADLEQGSWPFGSEEFGGILVSNYLWRPLFTSLIASLKPEGILLYETFAVGNEAYGRPKNPDFLLEEGELLKVFRDFDVLDYYHGTQTLPQTAVRQGIVARKPAAK